MPPYRPTTDFHQQFDAALPQGDAAALACVRQTHEAVGTPNTFEPELGGFSGLYWVCLRGHLASAQWLLAQGAEPNGDHNGTLPGTLLAAVSGRNVDVVRLLIAAGADVHARDAQRDTPLLKAVNRADLPTCELLLRAGADPSLQNVAGVSALNTRLHRDHQQTFEDLFRRHGHTPEFDVYEQSGSERFQQWLAARREQSE